MVSGSNPLQTPRAASGLQRHGSRDADGTCTVDHVPAGVSLAQQSSSAARASSSDLKGIRPSTASAHALEWQHL